MSESSPQLTRLQIRMDATPQAVNPPPQLVSLAKAARFLDVDTRTLKVRLTRLAVRPDAVDGRGRPLFDASRLKSLPTITPPVSTL